MQKMLCHSSVDFTENLNGSSLFLVKKKVPFIILTLSSTSMSTHLWNKNIKKTDTIINNPSVQFPNQLKCYNAENKH